MADGFIRPPPDSSGKFVDTTELTVGINTVQRQRIVISGDNALDLAPVSATRGLKVDMGADNDVDLALLAGSAVSVNAGTADAGTQRVTLASDQSPLSIDDNGGSITIDGTVGISGTVTVSQTNAAALDYDTGGPVVNQAVFGVALPGAGGPVAGGTSANPLRTDPTGTTSQPVDDNGGSLTVDNPALSVVGGGGETGALRVTVANNSTGVLSVDDNGGSLTVDNPTLSVTGGGTEAGALRVTLASDSTGNVSVDDGGGSLTVDGTVGVSGTVAVDQVDTASLDYDTGGGTVNQSITGLALPGAGGPVAGGTASNPVRTDPTGSTAQPVTDGGSSLTIDSPADATHGTVHGGSQDGLRVMGSDGTIDRQIAVDSDGRPQVDVQDRSVKTASASATGTGVAATLAMDGHTACAIQIAGTWSASMTWEVTVDGTNWVAAETRFRTVSGIQTIATGTSLGNNGIIQIDTIGVHSVRVNVTSYTSGTIEIALRASMGSASDPATTLVNQGDGTAMGASAVTPLFARLAGPNSPGFTLDLTMGSTPASTQSGIMPLAERDDALSILSPETDGQLTSLRTDSRGQLWARSLALGETGDTLGANPWNNLVGGVNSSGELEHLQLNDSGDLKTVDLTTVIEGASAVTSPRLIPIAAERDDNLSVLPEADGDWSHLRLDSLGRLRVASDLQTVAGTATTAGIGNVAAGTQRVVLASDQPDLDVIPTDITEKTQNSSLTAAAQTSQLEVAGYGAASIQLTGTWTATVLFETSNDGTNWSLTTCRTSDSRLVVGFVSSATALNSVSYFPGPCRYVRARVAAYTSGTIVVDIRATIGTVQHGGVTLTDAAGQIVGNAATLPLAARPSDGASFVDPARSQNDNTAFATSQDNNPVALLYDTTPPSITDGNVGLPRMNAARMAMVLPGHPATITREYMTSAAQTNDAIIETIAAGTRIVVTSLTIVMDVDTPVTANVRIGFGTTAVPAEPTSGNSTTGVIWAGDMNIASRRNLVRMGDGHGVLAVGASDQELRITNGVPTGGKITVLVTYYTEAS